MAEAAISHATSRKPRVVRLSRYTDRDQCRALTAVVIGMNAPEFVELLLDKSIPSSARALLEASVHLPARSGVFVASFRDETGKQVQHSTGKRNRTAAQIVADTWEEEARRKRISAGGQPKKPTIRVRQGGPEHQAGLRTQAETAAMMKISERAVRELERSAFTKLRNNPKLRAFWREWVGGGGIKEGRDPGDWQLTQAETAALLGLAKTPFERQVLRRLIRLAGPWK
jgi:hypothetical protein